MTSVKSYNFRFGDEFQEFLADVNKAEVTYEVDPVEVDGIINETPDIRFNLNKSIKVFQRELQKGFHQSCGEIEKIIDEVYQKIDKLTLLARYLVEIESLQALLSGNSKEGFSHKKFSFSNLSTKEKYKSATLTEDGFQEYYYWMAHFLEKMHKYLLAFKSSIEIMPQADIKLPTSMLPDKNASSIQKPVEFFEYVFLRNGIRALRDDFIPIEDDYYYREISYNAKTETITTHDRDPETGEWEEYTETFKEVFTNRLVAEFNTSKSFIDNHVDGLKTAEEIKLFFTLLIGRLSFILRSNKKNKEALKYEVSDKPIAALIKYSYNRYAAFCPPKDHDLAVTAILQEGQSLIETIAPKQLPATNSGGTRTFKLKYATPGEFAAVSHQRLIDSRLIDPATEIMTVASAFDGLLHDTALKIKWIDLGKNKQSNKHTLFYLVNELAKAGIIEEDGDNNLLYQRLNFVFAKSDGTAFDNLKTSNNTSLKPLKTMTTSKKAINKLLDDLRSAGMAGPKNAIP